MLRLALLLLLSGSLVAADPKGIVFPSPPTPTPTPQPPGSALPVSPDRFFVVQSDADLIPVVSGVGKVKFTIEQGPIRVRGIFADGNGQYETRTLTAKTLVFVDPVSAGDAELLMIPVGVKDEASIARQRVTVLDGPRPPPEQDSQLVKDLKAAFALETDERPKLKSLASLYTKATTLADSATTWGELFSSMSDQAKSLEVSGKLAFVQKVIQSTLQAKLPWKGASDQPIDDAGRKTAKETFATIAAALNKVQ